ncbi:MAG TPA: hypothetical protein VK964_12075 [Nocardioidaceae bacterium]|nr:hypothetical protein [Nocardioidaceae bacterium]
MAAHDEQRAQLMEVYAVQARRLQLRQQAMRRELAGMRKDEDRLERQKEEIETKAAEADELLASLEAEQRQALAEEQTAEAEQAAPNPASGRADAVVDSALAQVGKAYVWASAGPGSYDCSGLTMMAWAQARRQPPALLGGPDERRHVGVGVRAPSRRSGLLLQPGQPRRHLPRQRADRRCRQPEHGRPGGHAPLHAVLRGGPAGLT